MIPDALKGKIRGKWSHYEWKADRLWGSLTREEVLHAVVFTGLELQRKLYPQHIDLVSINIPIAIGGRECSKKLGNKTGFREKPCGTSTITMEAKLRIWRINQLCDTWHSFFSSFFSFFLFISHLTFIIYKLRNKYRIVTAPDIGRQLINLAL